MAVHVSSRLYCHRPDKMQTPYSYEYGVFCSPKPLARRVFANPCERVAPPKRKRKEAQYLTLEQVAHLLELLQKEPEDMRCIITLLLYTGLRRSELLGLEWKDIDFQTGLLSIRRTSQYVAGKGVFTDETKTYHSRRVLKLADTALTLLRQHRAVQMQNRLRLDDRRQEHDRLFTRWDGAPMNPNSLTRRFHTFIHHTDLPPITVHSLRHRYVKHTTKI